MEFVDVVMKRRAVRRFEEGGVEPRGHRADRAARPAHAVGAASARASGWSSSRSPARREVARICGEEEVAGPTSGRGSASAPRSSSRASARRSITGATRSRTRSTRTAREIDWPVPFWWIDIGATMQNIMLAAVNEGLGCGFVGRRLEIRAPSSASRGVHADRRHARRAPAPRRAVTQPQAGLGAVRAVRPLGTLGGELTPGAASRQAGRRSSSDVWASIQGVAEPRERRRVAVREVVVERVVGALMQRLARAGVDQEHPGVVSTVAPLGPVTRVNSPLRWVIPVDRSPGTVRSSTIVSCCVQVATLPVSGLVNVP